MKNSVLETAIILPFSVFFVNSYNENAPLMMAAILTFMLIVDNIELLKLLGARNHAS